MLGAVFLFCHFFQLFCRKCYIPLGRNFSRRSTINSIAPGAIQTPINTALLNDSVKLNALLNQIPLRRLGKPEDVAGLAVFLASAEADYVTGTTHFVDGGLTWNYQEQ